jgi:cytochrome b subunit of formate dehydrogenase
VRRDHSRALTLLVVPAAARHVLIPLATVLLALAFRFAVRRTWRDQKVFDEEDGRA